MLDRLRISELRDEVGQDNLADVVKLFCEEVEETLDRLLSSSALVTPDDLHFLKGSALNIGMSGLGNLCQDAERALRNNLEENPDLGRIAAVYRDSLTALNVEICADLASRSV